MVRRRVFHINLPSISGNEDSIQPDKDKEHVATDKYLSEHQSPPSRSRDRRN